MPFTHQKPATCSDCGLDLPEGSPGARCPSCLFSLALTPHPELIATDKHTKPSKPPTTAPRYFANHEILGEIARGGMGVVYHARQLGLDRHVALKTIHTGPSASPEAQLRFELEIDAVAKLSHPNIISLYQTGECDGTHFFSMALLEGGDLSKLIAACPKPSDRTDIAHRVRLLRTVADAVQHAHEHGVLHRDLKPTNIVLDANGSPVVTDFGLVKRLGDDSSVTLSQAIVGSPSYMAPEQTSGKNATLTTAADIYSLGAVLYELLVGRPPFTGETPLETMRLAADTPPENPQKLNPAIDRDLARVCLKCLEKSPADRYRSAADLAADLGRWLDHLPVAARPRPALERAALWCRRKPALAASIAASVALLAALVVGATISSIHISQANDRHVALLRQMRLDSAETHLVSPDPAPGIATLAGILRETPTDTTTATRLHNALASRSFLAPAAVLRRHAPRVLDIATDTTNNTLVTGSLDGTIQAWDLSDPLATPEPEILYSSGQIAYDMAIAPDGRAAAITDATGVVTLWSADHPPVTLPVGTTPATRPRDIRFTPDSTAVAYLTGYANFHIRPVAPATPPRLIKLPALRDGTSPDTFVQWAVSHDGALAALSTERATVQVWDLHTASPTILTELQAPGQSVRRITFGKTAERLAASTLDGIVHVWEIGRWNRVTSTDQHAAQISSLTLSPDGRSVLTTSHDSTARLWSTTTGQPVTPPLRHKNFVFTGAFSPDSKRIVTGSADNSACLWDATTGELLASPALHLTGVASVGFSTDGQTLTTVCFDGTIWQWQPRGPFSTPDIITAKTNICAQVFDPSGETLYGASYGGQIAAWTTRGGIRDTPVWYRQLDTGIRYFDYHPATGKIAVSDNNATLSIIDVASGEISGSIDLAVPASWIAFSVDGSSIITADDTGTVARTALDANPIPAAVAHAAPVKHLARSPDGRTFTTVAENLTLKIWSLPAAELIASADGIHAADLAYSPDGATIAIAGARAIHLLDADTALTRSSINHPSSLHSIEFDPGGTRLLTACADGNAYLWELADTAAPLAVFPHGSPLATAAFSPDGTLVATGSRAGTARIWQTSTATPLTGHLPHDAALNATLFSPSGNALATSSNDATIRYWTLDPPTLPPASLITLADSITGITVGEDARPSSINASDRFAAIQSLFESSRQNPLVNWLYPLTKSN